MMANEPMSLDGQIARGYRAMRETANKVQVLLIERHLRAKKAERVLDEKYGTAKTSKASE